MTFGSQYEGRVVLYLHSLLSLYLHTIEGCSECGCWARSELVTTHEQHSTAGVGNVGIPQLRPHTRSQGHITSTQTRRFLVPSSPVSGTLHCAALVLGTGDVDSVTVWLAWRLLVTGAPTQSPAAATCCAAQGEKPWRH